MAWNKHHPPVNTINNAAAADAGQGGATGTQGVAAALPSSDWSQPEPASLLLVESLYLQVSDLWCSLPDTQEDWTPCLLTGLEMTSEMIKDDNKCLGSLELVWSVKSIIVSVISNQVVYNQ